MSEHRSPEKEQPSLTFTAHITPADAEKASRSYRLIQTIKLVAAFALLLLVFTAIVTLANGLPLAAMSEVLNAPSIWAVLIAYTAFMFVTRVWQMPRKARQALVEMYGDAPSWEIRYSFYDTAFRIQVVTKKTTQDTSISYADIRRVRKLPCQILLRCRQNLFAINILGMSASDAGALLKALRDRTARRS